MSNDDCLGRTMDVTFQFGVTEFFAALAGPLLRECNIPTDIAHLDTSSFSFTGQYDPKEPTAQTSSDEAADDRHPIDM